jgi:DNA-binding transcriptional ArsR family regulator
MRRDVFQAIADPNRRSILSILGGRPQTLNQVATHFEITRSAVSQHMKILEECGLVVIHKNGRERYCEARFAQLGDVQVWLDQYKKFWNEKFDAMETVLKAMQGKG